MWFRSIEECGSGNKILVALYLLEVAKNMEHLRQENAKQRQKEAENQNKKHKKENLMK